MPFFIFCVCYCYLFFCKPMQIYSKFMYIQPSGYSEIGLEYTPCLMVALKTRGNGCCTFVDDVPLPVQNSRRAEI
jgi:hypothetical protein